MKSRMSIGTRRVVLTLSLLVIISLLTIFQAAGSVHAAQKTATSLTLPQSFHEISDGTTYQWTLLNNGYWNVSQGRVDSGRWFVQQLTSRGYVGIGTISEGVNIFPTGSGHYGYALDTNTTIPNVRLQHETVVDEFPAQLSTLNNESPWGTGVKHRGLVYSLETPLPDAQENNANEHSVAARGALGNQLYYNGLHMLNEEDSNYRNLETDSGLYPLPRVTTLVPRVHSPAVLPLGVLALAAAGVTMGVAGGVLVSACGQHFCGKHSRTWAMVGGILAAIGTLCTIISGASVTGYIIAARGVQGPAAGVVAAAAMAEREVGLGSVYASARTSFEVAPDIQGAFAAADIF